MCKFGQEGSLSSGEYYLGDSADDSFSPAVNPRIKELIPFGQPKGCERFRVRIISRPGRRRWGVGEAKRERERNRQEEPARGRRTRAGMTWRKAREAESERERDGSAEGESERDGTRLDVRSAGNKDNSMQ